MLGRTSTARQQAAGRASLEPSTEQPLRATVSLPSSCYGAVACQLASSSSLSSAVAAQSVGTAGATACEPSWVSPTRTIAVRDWKVPSWRQQQQRWQRPMVFEDSDEEELRSFWT